MPSIGVFSTLPENFFSPLVWANREHYSALLILYYRLFQDNAGGLEREQVMRSFMDYLSRHRDALAEESEGADGTASARVIDTDTLPLDFGEGEPQGASAQNDRALAARFLRRLINTGWLDEETLTDYTRVINITPHARPFFEALARVDEGLTTEYESHVVAVYSLLCGDAAQENGHYAVLNAHNATTALIDSLKVLSQSIKGHYDKFTAEAAESGISGILRLHYDDYAPNILDGAYKRLKTSDNLSRYRPRVIKKIGELLHDSAWITASAKKFARLGSATLTLGESRQKLVTMLEEIRDTLRAVDPLLDDIDKRNMLYARSSTERVKTLLEPDSTIAGKLLTLTRAVYESRAGQLEHRVHGIRVFSPESLYRRHKREDARVKQIAPAAPDKEAQKRAQQELFERLRRKINPQKISLWLDDLGGREKPLASTDMVRDEKSFIHFIYGLLYSDSRLSFDYKIEHDSGEMTETEDYLVPDITLRRKK